MGFTLFMLANDPNAEKNLEHACANLREAFAYEISACAWRLEASLEESEIYAVSLATRENKPQDLQALAEILIQECMAYGYLPLDRDGKIIYILPEYGFDAMFHAPAKGMLMKLNEIVSSVCAECDNFSGSWISAPEIALDQGELFTVHIRMQDYLSPQNRARMRFACFFRLMAKATAAGFVAIPAT